MSKGEAGQAWRGRPAIKGNPESAYKVPEEKQIPKAPRNIIRRPLYLPPMERIKE